MHGFSIHSDYNRPVRAGVSGLAVSNRAGLGRLSRVYLLALAEAWPQWELHVFFRCREDLEALRAECGSAGSDLPSCLIPHFPPVAGLNRLLLEEFLLPAAFAPLRLDAYLGCDFTLPPRRLANREAVVVPDLLPFTRPGTVGWRARWLYRRGLVRAQARQASLLFISRHAQGSYERLFGPAPEGSQIAYPALSPRMQALAARARLEDHPLQVIGTHARLIDPGRFILYVGRNDARKNLPLLVSAYCQLVQSAAYRGSLVLAGGDGRYHTAPRPGPMAMQFAGSAGPEPSRSAEIHDLGRVSDYELSQLYDHADLLVNLSKEEGFGYPVLEALAHALPALVTAGSSMLEISDGGIAATRLDQASVVNRLGEALGALPLLRAEAQQFDATRFSIQRLGVDLASSLEQ